jgi:hypothetical protein
MKRQGPNDTPQSPPPLLFICVKKIAGLLLAFLALVSCSNLEPDTFCEYFLHQSLYF